jgi:alkylation response protein AidB-like acyl-CoA dehydrogenase
MIEFSISEDLIAKKERIRHFVSEEIVPYETDPRLTVHGPNSELRQELIEISRKAGLLSIQTAKRYGGWDLSHIEQAVLYEAAGWSTLGPVAMNCSAPDDGNMSLLDKIANENQSDLFLRPIVEGHSRSVFAMTEPEGAGSDPGQLRTKATFDGKRFSIEGRKWLITGAVGASTWIIMALLEPNDYLPSGPTLFLASGQERGIVIERVMNSMDRNYVEGHGVVRFDQLTLPEDALLGEAGQALRYAQLRLAPARLTHCMRWLGAATRAHTIAISHARSRTAFGKPIGEHQAVSFMLADNEIALQQCRLAIWHTCWQMDQGSKGRHESSMTKAYVSEELFKVVDRCVQILGGIGVTEETPVAMIFRDIRAFRLYDGPTEVHKFAIGRQIMREGTRMVN